MRLVDRSLQGLFRINRLNGIGSNACEGAHGCRHTIHAWSRSTADPVRYNWLGVDFEEGGKPEYSEKNLNLFTWSSLIAQLSEVKWGCYSFCVGEGVFLLCKGGGRGWLGRYSGNRSCLPNVSQYYLFCFNVILWFLLQALEQRLLKNLKQNKRKTVNITTPNKD